MRERVAHAKKVNLIIMWERVARAKEGEKNTILAVGYALFYRRK